MGDMVSRIAKSINNASEKEAKAKEQLKRTIKVADTELNNLESGLKTLSLDAERTLPLLS